MSESSWDTAPSWAMWRTKSDDGDVTYWECKPALAGDNAHWWVGVGKIGKRFDTRFAGRVFGYVDTPNWRETLEQRP